MEYIIVQLSDGRYALANLVAVMTKEQLQAVCASGEALVGQAESTDKKK